MARNRCALPHRPQFPARLYEVSNHGVSQLTTYEDKRSVYQLSRCKKWHLVVGASVIQSPCRKFGSIRQC